MVVMFTWPLSSADLFPCSLMATLDLLLAFRPLEAAEGGRLLFGVGTYPSVELLPSYFLRSWELLPADDWLTQSDCYD